MHNLSTPQIVLKINGNPNTQKVILSIPDNSSKFWIVVFKPSLGNNQHLIRKQSKNMNAKETANSCIRFSLLISIKFLNIGSSDLKLLLKIYILFLMFIVYCLSYYISLYSAPEIAFRSIKLSSNDSLSSKSSS